MRASSRRWTAIGFIAAELFAVALAHAQGMEPEGLRRQSEAGDLRTGTTTMPIASPDNPEVLQAGREFPYSTQQARSALEHPIDPTIYVCGSGDVLELNMWGRQNLRVRVTVDTEGRIFVSKVGYFIVAGHTLQHAREEIRKGVLRYYPGLNFDLSLVEPRTFLVHVVDFVARPGIYRARPIDRVSAVVENADHDARPGETAAAEPNAVGSRRLVKIERRDGTKLAADLTLYELTGDVKYNPLVSDGDVIRVPAIGPVVRISGAVARPGKFELANTKDLTELLSLAGGFSRSFTNQLPIQVVRRGQNQRAEQVSVSVSDAGRVPSSIPLSDGDAVFVPTVEDLQPSVFLLGPVAGAAAADEVTSVRRLPYYRGATVRGLIEKAGGLGVSADLKRAYISRKNGSTEAIDLDALLIRRDFSVDKTVDVGDTIVIPQQRLGVVVQGAVVQPGSYPQNPRFTVREYLAIAGGPNKQAQRASSFRVVTRDGKAMRATPDLHLNSGDVLYVPERTLSHGEIVQLVIGSASLVVSTIALGILVLR